MKHELHLVTSIPLTAAVYLYFKSKIMSLGFLIGYIFIDLDHILDYFITCGINVDIKRFFEVSYKHQYKTLVLFFHSYEALILLWFCAYFLNLKEGALLGVLLGFTVHLVFDHLTNPIYLMGYFITFRIFRKFESSRIWRIKSL